MGLSDSKTYPLYYLLYYYNSTNNIFVGEKNNLLVLIEIFSKCLHKLIFASYITNVYFLTIIF